MRARLQRQEPGMSCAAAADPPSRSGRRVTSSSSPEEKKQFVNRCCFSSFTLQSSLPNAERWRTALLQPGTHRT